MSTPSPLRVVRLTPPGRGAVATVVVEGPEAVRSVEAVFRPKGGRPLASYPSDRLVFGHFQFGSRCGEEMVVRRRSDGAVELHCHGGQAAVAMIERAFVGQGAEVIAWRDWVLGRDDDPIAGDAQLALADARTERTAAILLDQFHGALRQAVEAIRQSIRAGELAAAGRQVEALLARADLGRHLVEPWNVVLAGAANVGKSSLINAVVGYNRAIVDPGPGTTRDVVTATTAVDGWPVELADTAGLRKADEPVEQAGIELARRKLSTADLVILVFDFSGPWSDADQDLSDDHPRGLVVHNKCDLPRSSDASRPAGLLTSALTGEGIEKLVRSIAGRLVADPPPPGAAVPFTAAQIERLRSACEAIAAGDQATAADMISQI